MLKRKSAKLFAFVLSTILLFSSMPFSIGATAAPTSSVSTEQNTIFEVKEYREENVKHFQLPDGTYQAVIYSNAVHRKNANDEWVDIDNRLFLKSISGKQVYAAADQRTRFTASTSTNSTLMTLEENGYVISCSLAQTNKAQASYVQISNHNTRQEFLSTQSNTSSLEAISAVENTSTLKYTNILPNVDIEYVLSSNDIKENIILNGRSLSYNYIFELCTQNLTPTLHESGAILFSDNETGKTVYYMPAPYMYDANNVLSHDVSYNLLFVKEGLYLLSVSANSDWINDEQRAFPVIIDPSIFKNMPVYDVHTDPSQPNTNFGLEPEMWLNAGNGGLVYIHTALPSAIPSSARILSASLELWFNFPLNLTNANYNGSVYSIAKMVLKSWDEQTITWNSSDRSANALSSSVYAWADFINEENIPDSSRIKTTVDITQMMQLWYSGTPNYGVALQYDMGSRPSVCLYATESSQTQRPGFFIHYDAFEEGLYRVKNLDETDGEVFLTIDDAAGPGYTQENADIEVWSYGLSYWWRFVHVEDSYYKIVSSKSGKVVAVPSNQTAQAGTTLVQQEYDENNDHQLWKVVSTLTGYTLHPKSNENLCMAADDAQIGYFSERKVLQKTYSEDSNLTDTWDFVPYSVLLVGIPDTREEGHNHISVLKQLETKMLAYGWKDVTVSESVASASALKEAMKSSNIFIIRTHGTRHPENSPNPVAAAIVTNDPLIDQDLEYLFSHNPSKPSTYITDEDNFSNVDIAFFIACETGYHTETNHNNFPARLVELGAKAAIGITSNCFCSAANIWLAAFYEELEQGASLQEALEATTPAPTTSPSENENESQENEESEEETGADYGILRSEVVIYGNADFRFL